MSEIATVAQVQRPVVSNWRRRHPDFPAAVEDGFGRPVFDGEQVIKWLISTGLGNADPAHLQAEITLFGLVAQTGQFSAGQLVEIVGSLLCLRKLGGRPLTEVGGATADDDGELWAAVRQRAERIDVEDEFVLRELRSVDAGAAPLVGLAEDLVEAAYDERGAYEWLLASRARLGLDALVADAVAPELEGLLGRLADLGVRLEDGGSVTIADPHAGIGDLLVGLLRGVDDREQITALAAEPDERPARVARRRLLLAGIDELSLDVQIGNELEERLADPDLIVTQIPYRPGEDRSVLRALEGVERIADLLRPGSTALVLGPADALVDALQGTEESRMRSALLRGNIVEAVIALPGGALPFRPGYRSALWILTRGAVSATKGKVLLADISAEPLTEGLCARLAEDVLLWRAEGFRDLDGHDPRYGHAANIADLEDAFGGPLTPLALPASAILSRTVTERPAYIAEAEGRLERAANEARSYDDAHGPYWGEVLRRQTRGMPQPTTLGALIAEGRVARLRGYRINGQHLTKDGHHTVFGAEEITGGSAVGSRRVDRLVLAAAYDRVALTEPGDVVYTLVPRLGFHVDEEGFGVVVFPARVLRVNPCAARPLTPRVLAALLGAARNTGRSPGAVRAARRIEEYRIPDLDPVDVERFDAMLAETERRERMLCAQVDALAEARRLTIAGIADGTLTLGRT